MCRKRFSVRSSQRILLAVLVLGLTTPFAAAQTIGGLGGGGGGGGLNSTGGGGGGSSGSSNSAASGNSLGSTGGIGTAKSIGSGNLSALTSGSVGLSSLSATTTGAATAGSSSIPVASDPFSSFYFNPYSQGLIGTTNGNSGQFGQPAYTPSALPTALAAPSATFQAYKVNPATGYSSVGSRKTPAYVTAAGYGLPLVKHNPSKLQTELQQVLTRSASRFSSKSDIRVEILDGGIVRLTGSVLNAHEQELAEALIRMTPGVQNVQNDLQATEIARGY